MATTSGEPLKRFILLGETGSGKSAFINLLYTLCYGTTDSNKIFCERPQVKIAIPCLNWLPYLDDEYKKNKSERNIDNTMESQTQMCTKYRLSKQDMNLELIDTPGFNDTHGTNMDDRNLALIGETLKGIPFLSGIIIVANGSSNHIGVSFQNFIHLLYQVWPNDLMANCVAVLTNCDESTVNLDSMRLKNLFNVQQRRVFHFQNSLFRWNPSNLSERVINHFKEDFDDNVTKLQEFSKILSDFNDVSTKAFSVSAIKIAEIENYIAKSMQSMIELLEAYKKQHIAEAAIQSGKKIMDENASWEKHHTINATKWGEVPGDHSSAASPMDMERSQEQCQSTPGTMQSRNRGSQNPLKGNSKRGTNQTAGVVGYYEQRDNHRRPKDNDDSHTCDKCGQRISLQAQPGINERYHAGDEGSSSSYSYGPREVQMRITYEDKEARFKYESSKQQVITLKEKSEQLQQEGKKLKIDMKEIQRQLRQQVEQLLSINRNYDILQKNMQILQTFDNTLKFFENDPQMREYYMETIKILTNK